MPVPSVSALRKRLPALCAVLVLHVVVIDLLLEAIPKASAPASREAETKITLLPPPLPSLPAAKKRPRRSAAGTNAITPTFNPDTFRPSMLQPPGVKGLTLALNACAPESYDMASYEIRAACDRIGAIITADPGRFGVNPDFIYGRRWQRELLVKQTPFLMPCITPAGPDVLTLLTCVADILLNGYHADRMMHYSK